MVWQNRLSKLSSAKFPCPKKNCNRGWNGRGVGGGGGGLDHESRVKFRYIHESRYLLESVTNHELIKSINDRLVWLLDLNYCIGKSWSEMTPGCWKETKSMYGDQTYDSILVCLSE